ncbi:hypothetical protein ACP70R_010806 [Stipagrostis hirtigluma subsp. patula]
MSKRTVLRVDTSCAKCKRKVLQAVSGLQGVDKIEVDSKKGTMTVTGSVDPVDVIVQTRKAGKRANVVTIGPPPKPEEKKPEQQGEKKTEKKATEQPATVFVHHVPSWPACPRYHERVVCEYDPPSCSIM